MEAVGVIKNKKIYIQTLEGGGLQQQKPPKKRLQHNSILQLLAECKEAKNILYIRNIRKNFDFILTGLEISDYNRINKKADKQEKTYYIKQNQRGVIYEISIYLKKRKYIQIKDIDNLLITRKLDSIGDELQELEKIVKKLHAIGCRNTSLASFGFTAWTRTLNNNYRAYFPPLTDAEDENIRQAYNHGVYYFNRSFLYKKIENGVSLDVNSMYPYILKNMPLPMQSPLEYEGEYKQDILYPLYIQELYITILENKNKINYLDREQLEGLPIRRIWASSVELETLKNNYNIEIIKYGKGYKFKMCRYLFDRFVSKWYDIKRRSSEPIVKQGCFTGQCFTKKVSQNVSYDWSAEVKSDPIMANFSKIVLNTLVGQFGRKPYTISRTPHLKNGVVEYTEERKKSWSVYLPLAVFVVDYGRQMITEMAQKVKDYSLQKYGEDRYIYTDTDCIRTTLPLEDLQELFEINQTELGKFKIEEQWESAYFCGIKSYVTKQNGKINFHVAGLETHEHKKWLQENEIKL